MGPLSDLLLGLGACLINIPSPRTQSVHTYTLINTGSSSGRLQAEMDRKTAAHLIGQGCVMGIVHVLSGMDIRTVGGWVGGSKSIQQQQQQQQQPQKHAPVQ